jgi:hypothetical protein
LFFSHYTPPAAQILQKITNNKFSMTNTQFSPSEPLAIRDPQSKVAAASRR